MESFLFLITSFAKVIIILTLDICYQASVFVVLQNGKRTA